MYSTILAKLYRMPSENLMKYVCCGIWNFMKKARYYLQAQILRVFLWMLGMLSFRCSSNLMGFLGRVVGPSLKVTRVAYTNLKMVMPEAKREEHNKIVNDMWDQLGRVVGEYPHLAKLSPVALKRYVHLSGIEHLKEAAAKGKGGIVVSGHYGNWEVSPRMLHDEGYPLCVAYREANNPYVNELIDSVRNHYFAEGLPKGGKGIRGMIRALKRNDILGVLVDQKVNTGKAVPLFGMDAMTSTTVAELALRFDCPIIPLRIVRRGRSCEMDMTIYPPLEYKKTDDQEADIIELTKHINRQLESWILDDPEQWFWVHRRWPKETY